jgi:hypothetical protein
MALPPLVPPLRFSQVEEGVYRGAYPSLVNQRFLTRLGLRTIVSLLPEPPTADLLQWCEPLLTRTPRGFRTVRTGHAFQPRACFAYLRRRAACPPWEAPLYVPSTRTTLGRAVLYPRTVWCNLGASCTAWTTMRWWCCRSRRTR